MVNLDSLIQSIGDKPMPPVEQWDPEFCGELDLFIKADGTWLYSGTPLTREKIKHLFSRVIKKQSEEYFLVTPVEKVAIQVEWQPFLIVDFNQLQVEQQNVFQFIDNFNNKILLTDKSQLEMDEFQSQKLPILRVRRNLFANFSRNCYYRLIEQAEKQFHQEKNKLQIISNDITFCLGQY